MFRRESRLTDKELKKFARAYDFVTFSKISEDDDLKPIGGLSLSKYKKDKFFAHGNSNGRDISLVRRLFKTEYASSRDKEHDWTIVRIVLNVEKAPHIYIDGENNYQIHKHLVEVLGQLRYVNEALKNTNSSFTDSFHIFSKLQASYLLSHYLHDNLMQQLFEHYAGFSFEIFDDELFVYRSSKTINIHVLDKMLEAGLWLAEQIEYSHAEYRGIKE